MPRKIPKSRKHKKLKFVDPAYTGPTPRSKRNKKNLLPNQPPRREDYQQVPRHMKELIDVKNDVKANKLKKKRSRVKKDDFIVVERDRAEVNEPGMTRPVQLGAQFIKQGKYENECDFLDRLQDMADSALADAKLEEKFDIDLVEENKSSEVPQFQMSKKETSEKKKEKRKKYKEKANEKKKAKLDDAQYELKKEHVPFGEVVEAPPQFTTIPRRAPQSDTAGKRGLVLKQLLNSDKQSLAVTREVKPLQRTRLKYMAPEKRKMLENESSRAVQMYRLLKQNKTRITTAM